MQILDTLFGSLGKVWADFNRMHRGGLGESPRGLADYRRNRWIVGTLLVIGGAVSLALWFFWFR
ncbi:MAG: hypothetical protein ACK5WD_08375 [bacterium]|jgi:hypothetical protein